MTTREAVLLGSLLVWGLVQACTPATREAQEPATVVAPACRHPGIGDVYCTGCGPSMCEALRAGCFTNGWCEREQARMRRGDEICLGLTTDDLDDRPYCARLLFGPGDAPP